MAGYREHTGAAQGGLRRRPQDQTSGPWNWRKSRYFTQEGQEMREWGASLLGDHDQNDSTHVRAKQVLKKGPSLNSFLNRLFCFSFNW